MALTHDRIEVDPKEAHDLVSAGEGVLVDVREPWEWSGGHASGAQLISLGNLQVRERDLPKDLPVLFICASGNRSYQAAQYFRQRGFDARSVAGGTAMWQMHRLPVQVA